MTQHDRLGANGERVYALLRDFASLAVGHVASHGTLLDANAAFQALVGGAAARGSITGHFLEPGFDDLISLPAVPGQCVYRGLLKIGREAHLPRPVRGIVYRVADGILVIAEPAEMAQLTAMVSTLRAELAGRDRTIARMAEEIDRQKRAMGEMVMVDPLTGLPNRRRLEEMLDAELERARRYRIPLSVVIADPDQLEEVNRRYGREAGDTVLKRCGQLIAYATRRSDLPARYSGATFLTVLTNSGLQGAMLLAERVRTRIAATAMPPATRSMTASFGVTEFRDADSMTALFDRAEAALRQAKNAGRNCVQASA